MAERRKGDADYLAAARVVGFYTLTSLIALSVAADTFGRLFFNATYQTDSSIFIPLVTAWTALMGLETASLLRQRLNGKDDDDAPPRS